MALGSHKTQNSTQWGQSILIFFSAWLFSLVSCHRPKKCLASSVSLEDFSRLDIPTIFFWILKLKISFWKGVHPWAQPNSRFRSWWSRCSTSEADRLEGLGSASAHSKKPYTNWDGFKSRKGQTCWHNHEAIVYYCRRCRCRMRDVRVWSLLVSRCCCASHVFGRVVN